MQTKAKKTLPAIKAGWLVPELRDSELFFRSVGMLIPRSALLVLVESSMAPDVHAFSSSHAVPADVGLPVGTVWPAPRIHCFPAEPDLLAGLAELAARHAEPEICDHVMAHNGEEVLLAWYDAFVDPLIVSAAVGESKVQIFCSAVGATHERWQAV